MSLKFWRGIVIVISLTLIGIGIRGILLRSTPSPKTPEFRLANSPSDVQTIRDLQSLKDRETLETGKGTSDERLGALVRLAQKQDLKARDRALEWKADSSPWVREAVANALGHYDDPISLKTVEGLLSDPVNRVRIQAIQALGHRRSEERVALLRKLLQASEAGDLSLHLFQSLYQASLQEADQKSALAGLLRLAAQNRDALTLASTLAPRSPEVISALQKAAMHSRDPILVNNAIRHLAITGDRWLVENLQELWKKPIPEIKKTILHSLPLFCPTSGPKLLREALLQSKEIGEKSAAMDVLLLLPGPESLATVREALANPGVPDAERQRLQGILSTLENPALQNPCARR